MKLSIITINYNNKDGLQKTIDSVICQTWKDYEWIVIDGGSTDGSKELIEQYQQHFAYWCSEPDKGVYNAMNKGIAKAKGEYIQFLNSGDCFHQVNTLEMVSVYLGQNADVFYGDLNYLSVNDNYIIHYPKKLTMHYFLSHSIGHPASYIKAELLKSAGYREDFKIVSDWFRFVEWFREGRVFRHMNVVVADYDTTGISSVNLDLISKENEIVYNELFGCENRKWIEESQKMQYFYEDVDKCGFWHIRKYGGRRFTLLLWVIRMLNKTLK
ncbi:Glycosyltransferase involved in cell wall bisynthesis [Prevotella sp. tc2-28]|uniref:glycosyltransferase family 2 protein n=1 Tax=Prevotella sp. tc2-28 TaxID=1761888 RepID=UPI00089D40B0|nr:glycosyltransferase family 2 protein [Prevotella sp. tc2-28]SEA92529.1 Glycosyltransferase involved in cell wall bisynthesis [Prevotella sp. tc2-28]